MRKIKIKTFHNYKTLVKQMGVRWCFDRSLYELYKRTGILEKKNKFNIINEKTIANLLKTKNKKEILSQFGFFFLEQKNINNLKNWLGQNLDYKQKETIKKIANNALIGKILCFSKWYGDFGNPIDWTKNPITNFRFTTNKHWTKMDELIPGQDIKFVWEASRFPHAYYFLRANLLTEDEKFVESFWHQVDDWIKENPVGYGPNWFCGQEVALRVMTWTFCFFVFYNSPKTSSEIIFKVLGSIWAHAFRIEKNIKFATRVLKNNHAISEAVALYTIGVLFPFFPEAKRWEKKGLKYLTDQGLDQINCDGSYIQNSFNYQRMIVQLYSWYISIARANGREVNANLQTKLKKTVSFLYSVQDEVSGRVPNYGPNDGSLPFLLSSCDYLDYRPQLKTLWYLLTGEELYPKGVFDEEKIWFVGKENFGKDRKIKKASEFRDSGHFVFQGMKSWGYTRCTSHSNRPGHADMLHFDLWWNGKNVLIDGGTYSYNASPWTEFFQGTGAHNTLKIDAKDQMEKWKRFSWLNWTKGKVNWNYKDHGFKAFEGEHYGYGDVIHRRGILQRGDFWLIIDDAFGKRNNVFKIELQWLLGNINFSKIKENKIQMNWKNNSVLVEIFSSKPASFSIERAVRKKNNIRGWQSVYYGEKEPTFSLKSETIERQPQRFYSLIYSPTEEKEFYFGKKELKFEDKTIYLNDIGEEKIFDLG